MLIGNRIRAIREAKHLSQGDIEKRCGLHRVYISRVENRCVVPSVETLEKPARALEAPIYQLFYKGEEPPRKAVEEVALGRPDKDSRFLATLSQLLARMRKSDQQLLLHIAQKMAKW